MTVIDFLMSVFVAELGLIAFLMFGSPSLPWHRRAWAAMASAGMALSFLAVIFGPGTKALTQNAPDNAWLGTLALLDVALFAKIFLHFLWRKDEFSCLGTVGRMIGCAIVAWGTFALIVLTLGTLIAVAS